MPTDCKSETRTLATASWTRDTNSEALGACSNIPVSVHDATLELAGRAILFYFVSLESSKLTRLSSGIRSDSDLYTFGFPWRPWEEKQPIAQGPLILKYMKESAAEAGIDKHIKFHHKVDKINWSSKAQSWTFNVTVNGTTESKLRSRFVFLGTGYYNYDEPLDTQIPGIDKFKGQVVHPQFWPTDLDYTDKNVVIIGSGATAITLLPNIANKAAHATMLQRSPSYVISVPSEDPLDKITRFLLPGSISKRLIRFKWIFSAFLLTTFCKWFPTLAKRVILRRTSRALPKEVPLDPHFIPKYNPWEQRMCLCPGNDFFKSLNTGKASVATGVIDKVSGKTIRLKSGQELHPDIIVTATGLKLHLAGGIKTFVDGKQVSIPDNYAWKGAMLENLPNLVVSLGYVDASWTLGADATAQLATRLLSEMSKGGYSSITPQLSDDEKSSMKELPFMSLNSTYVKKGGYLFPKVGTSPQWQPRSYYWKDMTHAWWGDIRNGLLWTR